MDIEQLKQKIRDEINRTEGDDKKYYTVLDTCLNDTNFTNRLSEGDRNDIININNNFNGQRDFEWFRQNSPSTLNPLSGVYFKGLTFLTDKRKNVSYFEERTKELNATIDSAQTDLMRISETAKLLNGTTVLAEYAKEFDNEACVHRESASSLMKWLIWSIVGLFVLLALVLFVQITELPIIRNALSYEFRQTNNAHLLALAIKAALVFAYLQVPAFIKRNYFAEKHLQQAYLHRRDVLKALNAVYNSIQDPVEKDKIIVVGAAIAFSESESGYITRKEGAGETDLTESILSRLSLGR